ncbi:cytochrome P450 4C1-like [Daktulosphaira vitifoliae]|uniref:cytochrome P450 4C1-like n=1 Tax=Daktulosphaira vitifoliae TaxID=58002 RepID=UPI0021AA4656|nr:cytochrome P450 4C1-like [Daktulosphaira vitifoliae]XP_050530173.1 cytochrome P450 4C1-like [Daktulosphaira vitifoliae]XP_050530174.1 cytochrome P450 4C1-like [Daktulosphaira vitifoliae]XP_050530175.1 cytochrome P450 4C1-like [Daktulosphaira vitifoliae]XP_050530176.1 cytochrome P450 4C1-like [Daktulosphaira vitifoliae]
MEMVIYSVSIIMLSIWFHWRWKNKRFCNLASKLPGPISYPFIGTASMYTPTYEGTVQKIEQNAVNYDYEPVGTWIGPFFYVSVVKPEDIQIVLNNSKALEKGFLYSLLKSLLGEGLLTAPVDKWRKHRRIISYAFNVKFLEKLYPVFNEKNRILVNDLKSKLTSSEPFDLWNNIISTTFDTICDVAMDYQVTEPQKKFEFLNLLTVVSEELVKDVNKPWLYWDKNFSIYKNMCDLGNNLKAIKELPLQLIKEKKQNYQIKKSTLKPNGNNIEESNLGNKFRTFMDCLLLANESDPDFSDDDVLDEVITMLYAGSDTSGTTECFCLLMLAIHQDIQDEVYDEIYNAVGDSDREFTPDDMAKLVYLDQVLKETLRMFPILPVFTRQLQDDVKLSNYVLPKGTGVTISPMVTHQAPYLYPNPNIFNPDNFSPVNVANRHKYSFIAFSGGPRGCLGMKYAMMAMKLLISEVLRNFSIHTDIKLPDIKVKMSDGFIRKIGGYPITIRIRDKKPSYLRKTISSNCK